MISQSRYILNAFLILFLLLFGLFIFEKNLTTDSIEKSGAIIDDSNNESKSSENYGAGKSLFTKNCTSCHSLMKDMAGPALAELEERGPWRDRQKLYEWVHNPPKFMASDGYTKSLKEKFGIIMTAFPDLTEKDIDAIVDYINSSHKQESMPVAMSN